MKRFFTGNRGGRPSAEAEPDLHRMADPEQIAAYFEELGTLRTQCLLAQPGKNDSAFNVIVEHVHDQHGVAILRFHRPLPVDLAKGTEMGFDFTLPGGRYSCKLPFLQREGYLQYRFSLPSFLVNANRRSNQRTKLTPRERAKATMLEGLGSGVGATGSILDLSPWGISLKVDKVVQINGDRRLPLEERFFLPGKVFGILRMSGIPQCPMIECAATVANVRQTPKGLIVGLNLLGLGAVELRALDAFILRRTMHAPSPLFPRRSRKGDRLADSLRAPSEVREGERPSQGEAPVDVPDERLALPAEEGDGDDQEVASGEAGTEELDGIVAEMKDLLATFGPMPEALEFVPETEPIPDLKSAENGKWDERVMRFRRGLRRVMLVVSNEDQRTDLVGDLKADGYRSITLAGSMVKALGADSRGVDVLVLESQVGAHPGLVILDKMRASGLPAETKIIVFSEKPSVREVVAAKAQRLRLVDAPLTYPGPMKEAMDELLKRPA